MSILDIFRRNTDDESKEEQIPDKPDDAGERKSKTKEYTVYEIEFAYRNGDTETVAGVYQYSRDENAFTYCDSIEGKTSWYSEGAYISVSRDERVHYETLDREPIVTEVGEAVFKLSWTQKYQKETHFNGSFKEWDSYATDVEVQEVDP